MVTVRLAEPKSGTNGMTEGTVTLAVTVASSPQGERSKLAPSARKPLSAARPLVSYRSAISCCAAVRAAAGR